MRSKVLYESLPMMRLGARRADSEVVAGPDFSTFAFMLEEYVALGVLVIVLPASSPEAAYADSLPQLLRNHVEIVDDSRERQSVNRVLGAFGRDLPLVENAEGEIVIKQSAPRELKKLIANVRTDLEVLALGFNRGLQISLIPSEAVADLRKLRPYLSGGNAKTLVAELEGVYRSYATTELTAAVPPRSPPRELVCLFDRIINDESYLTLSASIAELAVPETRSMALREIKSNVSRLLTKERLEAGWNYAGKWIKTLTGMPVPEMKEIASLLGEKRFPVALDLRDARKRAVECWIQSADLQPLLKDESQNEAVDWIVRALPSKWSGGRLGDFTLGTVREVMAALTAYQTSREEGHDT